MNTIAQLIEKYGVVMTVSEGAKLAYDKQDEWQRKATGYRITLRRKGLRPRTSFDYWQGSAITYRPQADEVLNCLLSDAIIDGQDFGSWCGDIGYDTDSRKAEWIYKQCVKQTKALKKVLNDSFDAFYEAERI